MKAALLYGKDDLRLEEMDRPRAGHGEIVVEIKACGVCPTDVRKLRTGAPGKQLPMNLGHEWAGKVVDSGEGAKFGVGDAVAGISFSGYTEYALIKAKQAEEMVFPVPKGLPWEEATLFEPLADCLHSLIDQAGVRMGSTVAVLGAGTMGVLHLLAALDLGARVAVSEIDASRLKAAKALGAHFTVDASEGDPVAEVRQCFGGQGADAVIATVTVPQLVNQALEMAAQGGAVVLFGGAVPGTRVTIDTNVIHYNELRLVGSAGVGRPAARRNVALFGRALDMLASGAVPAKRLITHRFPLDRVDEALAVTERREGLKAVLLVGGDA